MAKLLTRADGLAAQLPSIEVLVPEMGEDTAVRVRQMSVRTRTDYLERCRKETVAKFAWEDDQELPVAERTGVPKPAHFDQAVYAVVLSVVDENNNRLFSDADMPAFDNWPFAALARVYDHIEQLNGYDRNANAIVKAEKKG